MNAYSPELGRMIDPHEHPIVAPYFRGLPRQYWGYVDSTDIGPFSYNYEVDVLLTQLIRSGLVCQNPEYVFMKEHGVHYRDNDPKLMEEESRVLEENTEPNLSYPQSQNYAQFPYNPTSQYYTPEPKSTSTPSKLGRSREKLGGAWGSSWSKAVIGCSKYGFLD